MPLVGHASPVYHVGGENEGRKKTSLFHFHETFRFLVDEAERKERISCVLRDDEAKRPCLSSTSTKIIGCRWVESKRRFLSSTKQRKSWVSLLADEANRRWISSRTKQIDGCCSLESKGKAMRFYGFCLNQAIWSDPIKRFMHVLDYALVGNLWRYVPYVCVLQLQMRGHWREASEIIDLLFKLKVRSSFLRVSGRIGWVASRLLDWFNDLDSWVGRTV